MGQVFSHLRCVERSERTPGQRWAHSKCSGRARTLGCRAGDLYFHLGTWAEELPEEPRN